MKIFVVPAEGQDDEPAGLVISDEIYAIESKVFESGSWAVSLPDTDEDGYRPIASDIEAGKVQRWEDNAGERYWISDMEDWMAAEYPTRDFCVDANAVWLLDADGYQTGERALHRVS